MDTRYTNIKEEVQKLDMEELIKEYEESPDFTFLTMRMKNLANNLSMQEWVMNNDEKEEKDQQQALRNYIVSKRWLVIYDEYARSKGIEKRDFDQWLQKKLKTEKKGTKKIPNFINKMKTSLTAQTQESEPVEVEIIDIKKKEETKPKLNK